MFDPYVLLIATSATPSRTLPLGLTKRTDLRRQSMPDVGGSSTQSDCPSLRGGGDKDANGQGQCTDHAAHQGTGAAWRTRARLASTPLNESRHQRDGTCDPFCRQASRVGRTSPRPSPIVSANPIAAGHSSKVVSVYRFTDSRMVPVSACSIGLLREKPLGACMAETPEAFLERWRAQLHRRNETPIHVDEVLYEVEADAVEGGFSRRELDAATGGDLYGWLLNVLRGPHSSVR